MQKSTLNRGFTLVEMIVATALFSIVMLVSVSTLLALVNANRKAQAVQSVMNNLNIALDGMVRAAREGAAYNGAVGCTGGLSGNDCSGGSTTLSFAPRGNPLVSRWVYMYDASTKSIKKSYIGNTDPSAASAVAITAPEVTIDYMRFYVVGTATTATGNLAQPKVVIVVKGSAGVANTDARTTFHIQATAVQRVLDI